MNAIQTALAATFSKAKILPARVTITKRTVDLIVSSRSRYEAVSKCVPDVPWWAIAVIHNMECSLSFKQHLHNGDSLSARTHNVPAGRPKTGSPPFKWEDSAVDALLYDGLHKITDWTIGVALDTFEKFNGTGYRKRGIPSPYLWSFTNQYSSGKFIRDGVFSLSAVSDQVGVGALLKVLEERKLVKF